MKTLTQITMVSVATLALIGCGDSYKDKNEDGVSKASTLKASNRNAAFLVDTDTMSLYTFDKDALNKSNCDAECQKIWPLFEGANTGSEDIKVLEGTDHLAYRKHPLYYFANDKAPGDVLGNNVKDVWHLVHAPAGSTDSQTALSKTLIKQTFLTDKDQRALYTFDNDTNGVSNCYDSTPTSGTGCESIWPVFYSADLGALPEGTTAADFTVINRDAVRAKEGEPTQQVAYKGKPLYYFTPDNKEALSTKGDWVKGVWHLVELNAQKIGDDTTSTPTNNTDAGKQIYTNCASCHREDGLGTPGGAIKIGEVGDAGKIEELLNFMKNDGTGKNSIMVGIAKGLSEQQIKDVSAYIATLKK
ncbi:c-type cytochrome [Sulfurovum sp.]|uniref:c-type cytochrome n=1 Tax=Sulfurovum sp. TaxID=1969726 RepID=UPI0025E81899|nr:c-type cytochrome [Sulfurovum sp.]